MNSVERMWRAIGRGDYPAIAAQFVEHAYVEWPHSGERLSATEYVTRQRMAGRREVRVRRMVADDERVAVQASVDGRAVGGFYDLQQGRIAAGIEIWAG